MFSDISFFRRFLKFKLVVFEHPFSKIKIFDFTFEFFHVNALLCAKFHEPNSKIAGMREDMSFFTHPVVVNRTRPIIIILLFYLFYLQHNKNKLRIYSDRKAVALLSIPTKLSNNGDSSYDVYPVILFLFHHHIYKK